MSFFDDAIHVCHLSDVIILEFIREFGGDRMTNLLVVGAEVIPF